MKIVQINSVCGSGSTGKICVSISELLSQKGIENYILYASGNSDYPFGRRYMSSWEVKWNAGISRVMGNWGFTSAAATKRLIAELNKIRPDIVHLHNLHAHNVHLGLMFSYLKKNKRGLELIPKLRERQNEILRLIDFAKDQLQSGI